MLSHLEFLDAVIENVPHMIFVKEAVDLRFVRFNRAGEELLGRSRAELIGRNDRDFFPEKEADFFIEKDRAVLASGKVLDIPEERITTPQGTRILHTKKIPIHGEDGQAEYLLGISIDVTARKGIERRAAELAHEIRTPLGAMLGFAELALEEMQVPPRQRSYIETIARNARQLHRLVDEMLDLSKLEADLIEIDRTAFTVEDLLGDVSSLLDHEAGRKNLELRFARPTDCPRQLLGDVSRIRQILINVVGNSIKFTKDGGIDIVPRFRARGDKCYLDFLVVDTGIGMTADQTARLFEPYAQAECSTARRFGGTGLGLYISRKLARLMGGDVKLEFSAPGAGTRWSISVEVEVPGAAPRAERTEPILLEV